MRKFVSLVLMFVIAFTLLTCKKYDEGGLLRLTRKHLFGGNDIGDSKTWKLEKYEVNGIDSTYSINTGGIPDFYEKHITFKYSGKDESKFSSYEATTYLYDYRGKVDVTNKYLNLLPNHSPYNYEDSAQCKYVGNSLYCARNLLFPEMIDGGTKIWTIKKLTKTALILESNIRLTHTYRIRFKF